MWCRTLQMHLHEVMSLEILNSQHELSDTGVYIGALNKEL
jgi:hypothetical protein